MQRNARKHNGLDSTHSRDPYSMEDVVMPLHEYINHPMARDIVHNGATFQVSNLYSYWLVQRYHVAQCHGLLIHQPIAYSL